MQDSKPSICLVTLDAYGAMRGGAFGHVGGVERQTSLMARWLAGRGYPVSMVTWVQGPPRDEVIDGVRLIKTCRRSAGLPGVRFVYPRWTSLLAALRRADADLYYHNSAECVTGQVADWCRRHRRRMVYSVASDPACDLNLPTLKTLRERMLYRYGLRACDLVIVQSKKQQEMLRSGFGRDALPLPMPCPGPARAEYQPPPLPGPESPVIWVGRVAEMKRLELLLEIAAALPNLRFQVAGGGTTPYALHMLERARKTRNVVIRGTIPRGQMPALYRAAACLCCTSSYEGFPNTFLEAWSHGVPVVSTIDPDGLIARKNLGLAARDAGELIEAVRGLLASPERWRECSDNARRYYLEYHTPEAALPQFERALLDCLAASGQAAGDRVLAWTE